MRYMAVLLLAVWVASPAFGSPVTVTFDRPIPKPWPVHNEEFWCEEEDFVNNCAYYTERGLFFATEEFNGDFGVGGALRFFEADAPFINVTSKVGLIDVLSVRVSSAGESDGWTIFTSGDLELLVPPEGGLVNFGPEWHGVQEFRLFFAWRLYPDLYTTCPCAVEIDDLRYRRVAEPSSFGVIGIAVVAGAMRQFRRRGLGAF